MRILHKSRLIGKIGWYTANSPGEDPTYLKPGKPTPDQITKDFAGSFSAASITGQKRFDQSCPFLVNARPPAQSRMICLRKPS